MGRSYRKLSVVAVVAAFVLSLIAAFPPTAQALTGSALKSAQTGLCLEVGAGT